MSNKLSKRNSNHSKSTSLWDADFRERNDRVTYLSTNKKTETEFIGSVPPNSKVAGTLALVAATVQTGNLPRYGDGPARLTTATSSKGQIQAAAALDPYQDERQDYHSEGYPNGDQYNRENCQCTQRARDQTYSQNQERSSYQPSSIRQPNGGFPNATRHELDYKVAYHAKNEDRELYVSAPTGSNEAELFDEIARRVAKSNVSVDRITPN